MLSSHVQKVGLFWFDRNGKLNNCVVKRCHEESNRMGVVMSAASNQNLNKIQTWMSEVEVLFWITSCDWVIFLSLCQLMSNFPAYPMWAILMGWYIGSVPGALLLLKKKNHHSPKLLDQGVGGEIYHAPTQGHIWEGWESELMGSGFTAGATQWKCVRCRWGKTAGLHLDWRHRSTLSASLSFCGGDVTLPRKGSWSDAENCEWAARFTVTSY